jgi:hypothetical protein
VVGAVLSPFFLLPARNIDRTRRGVKNPEMEKGAGGSAPPCPPDPSHLIFIKRKEHAVFNSTLL